MLAVICHTVIVLALIGAYVVVTVNGGDGTAALGVLGGYIGGSGLGTLLTANGHKAG